MMGLCRDTNQNAKGLRYCADIEDILVKMGMEGTVEYATSLLNVANAYRTFGYYMKAQNLPGEAFCGRLPVRDTL